MTETNRIIGDAPCPLNCGATVKVKITKKNLLYCICDHTGGGCGHQLLCRDPAAEKHLARSITKWVKREDRLAYLGSEALPAKARQEPEPQPEPGPQPEAQAEPEELEPIEEPAAPPPPQPQRQRRQLPQALKEKQFKPGERKKSGGFLGMFED